MATDLHVERLPNGFIRVTDRGAAWSALYNLDGTYRSGATECLRYQRAAMEFMARA